jgi:hypothetical protein
MVPFEKLVGDKRREGDIDWLVNRLLELFRINVQLAAANQELRFINDRLQTLLMIARRKRGRQG